MEKRLNEHREDLIVANERIEVAAKVLTKFSPGDFQGEMSHDIGGIIQKECRAIQSIIGTFDEFSEAE